jgi:acetate kinase
LLSSSRAGSPPWAAARSRASGRKGRLTCKDGAGNAIHADERLIGDHAQAIRPCWRSWSERFGQARVTGIGHRVVHGGIDFDAPAVIDGQVVEQLARLIPLAALHQPHNLAGIAAAGAAFPGVLQVACFDTAFHRTQSYVASTYALPRRFYEEGVRRYGFHGLSYEYVAERLSAMSPRHGKGRVVVCHLGAGASLCGISDGKSVATTMGFSVLDGLAMATRPGQIDPGVLIHLMTEREWMRRSCRSCSTMSAVSRVVRPVGRHACARAARAIQRRGRPSTISQCGFAGDRQHGGGAGGARCDRLLRRDR